MASAGSIEAQLRLAEVPGNAGLRGQTFGPGAALGGTLGAGVGSQTIGATVTVEDLAEEGTALTPIKSFWSRAFAVLRPAISADYFEQEELKLSLRRHDVSAALERWVLHPAGLGQIGFSWAICGVPQQVSAPPASVSAVYEDLQERDGNTAWDLLQEPGVIAASFRAFVRHAPSLVRVLKVWIPFRVPVQPLALVAADSAYRSQLSGASSKQRFSSLAKGAARVWWHAKLEFGDAIVLDMLRCMHGIITLPGEETLANSVEAARQLRDALVTTKQSNRDAKQQDRPPVFSEALRVCDGIDGSVFDPSPYPLVGARYRVQADPPALVRRLENAESDVIGEIPSDGIVTVLEVGEEGLGRVKIYTEHARTIMLDGLSDGGGILSDDDSMMGGGITGWIMSAEYDGSPVLYQLTTLGQVESPPEALLSRLEELGDVLQGICSWVNATATASQGDKHISHAGWFATQVRDRHISSLGTQIQNSYSTAFEVQCIAVATLGSRHIAGIIMTAISIVLGACILERRTPKRSPTHTHS